MKLPLHTQPFTLEHCNPGQGVSYVLPGDFFLVHGDNFISRCIQFGQALRFHGDKAKYNYWTHAGIFINEDGDIIEALGTGVVKRNIAYYKDQKYAVVHILASDEDRAEAISFAKYCVNDGYGWATIVSIALSLLFGLKFSFGFSGEEICSGLVTRAMERTKFIPPVDPSHATPAQLASWYLFAS